MPTIDLFIVDLILKGSAKPPYSVFRASGLVRFIIGTEKGDYPIPLCLCPWIEVTNYNILDQFFMFSFFIANVRFRAKFLVCVCV